MFGWKHYVPENLPWPISPIKIVPVTFQGPLLTLGLEEQYNLQRPLLKRNVIVWKNLQPAKATFLPIKKCPSQEEPITCHGNDKNPITPIKKCPSQKVCMTSTCKTYKEMSKSGNIYNLPRTVCHYMKRCMCLEVSITCQGDYESHPIKKCVLHFTTV